MKNYIVIKAYKDNVSLGSVSFMTDNKDDALVYASLMTRNSDEGYTYHVFCTVTTEK